MKFRVILAVVDDPQAPSFVKANIANYLDRDAEAIAGGLALF
ncbi:hypothetical protein PFLUOLIPICF7_19890 [Pseudomonas simiae]|nr:hypothetical protein PFLUOLIPICF7_19890 [Pseudomonas simiae]